MAQAKTKVLAIAAAAIALVGAASARDKDWVLYNASPSVPPGFYVRVAAAPELGAFVTIRAVDAAPGYAALRGLTDPGDRFIKRVAAQAGDTVCAEGETVTVGGTRYPRARQDRSGSALPTWEGCRVLQADEVFLLGDTADSFDSRYFGIVRIAQIEGVWRPL